MEDIFKVKAYGRTELALMYFPDLLPNSAWHKLKAWIEGCKGLMERLRTLEYDGKKRTFTPRQVRAIVEYLDDPG